MSRRHGRGHHHERPRHEGPKPGTSSDARAVRAAEPGPAPVNGAAHMQAAPMAPPVAPAAPRFELPPPTTATPVETVAAAPPTPIETRPAAESRPPEPRPAPHDTTPGPVHADRPPNGHDRGAPCTAPQLRRFIKSRPYVPMHELRRRFAIDGGDDDVSSVELHPGRIFVGLPPREGQLLGELLKAGEIGYELSLDPRTPIVVGVYPMRPVPRP
jgi:hypothetical protein